MTNLTEQWKKGELPEWFYWIEFLDGKILPTTFSNQHGFICCDVICDEEKIKQILSAMPSYEQWQAKLEENTKLKERNDSLNNRDINLCRIANGIRDENFALKELLKEWLLFEKEENSHDFTIMAERMEELAKQTKEFLGDNNE